MLYFVFKKVPFNDVWRTIRTSKLIYLILATISFLLSQIISSSRLLLYFKAQSFNLSSKSNLVLYFIGMFYNFFIPGGIGGDAYKIYLLKKRFNWKTKLLASAVFFDRLNGLIGILCWIIALLMLFELQETKKLIFVFPIVLIGLIVFSKLFFQKMAPIYNSIFLKSLLYSTLIQGLQILCVLFILKSLNIEKNYLEYILIFLVSSVLSVISFAGIGVREFLFLTAAKFFNFNSKTSISIGLIFTIITAFIALLGLFFELKKKDFNLNKS
ncbi:lysylphosphatidylglycerol synthase transmembrane domain-containing protein [Urechidicola croceus]|uniref:lysylphosphatidylglycerol synthase transmembrane domain-containing protein n=1 Tax=Urechidicola croceus TaxID=1850246 RepID=UPI000A418D79